MDHQTDQYDSDPEDQASKAPAAKRRRCTPEERIAMREAEIAAIKEKRKGKVRESIAKARAILQEAKGLASACGMDDDAKACTMALNAWPKLASADCSD